MLFQELCIHYFTLQVCTINYVWLVMSVYKWSKYEQWFCLFVVFYLTVCLFGLIFETSLLYVSLPLLEVTL